MKIDNTARAARLPAAIRFGFVLLAGGVVLDLGYHALALFGGTGAAHSGAVATTVHGVVLAGMAVTFGGLLQVAFRPQGAVNGKET